VATGRPHYSDLVIDVVTQQFVILFSVPVVRDGQVAAVLTLLRPAITLGLLFDEQRLPPGWIAALTDRQHRILARSFEPGRFVGAPASPLMAARSAATAEGWFANRSPEGTPIYTAFSRVRSTGWTMVLRAPAAVVDAPGRRFLWLLVGGGLVLSAAAIVVALRLGWRLAAPIKALVPATQALAQGQPVALTPTTGAIQEVQEVVRALHEAASLLEQREAALHEQSARWHITLASIGDAVIATDIQGRVSFLNPIAAALTGWEEAEAIGQDITAVFSIINEYTRQTVENPITKVLREGTVVGLANHTLLLARDGVEHPIDDSGAPIRDVQGRLIGVVLVFRDITARRQAEETRSHLAAIVTSSEDAILSKTLDGIITSWNRSAERLYGYTAREMVGKSLTRLIPPDLADDLPQILARLRRGERIDHYETQRVTRDGARLDIALTISPIRDGAGQLTGAATIARDITARKQADAELERRRQETALLAALAQDLSASLDLDTVLQRIIAGAQALCGSERALIALREPGTDVLVGRYAIGAPSLAYAGLRIEPGQGLGGQVLRTGQPWRTVDYVTDPRFSKEYLAGAREAGHLAVLAVPIVMEGRVEGVLYASNPSTRPFTDRDEEILVRLAAHAALALQNAQLYRQAQTEIAERRAAEAALARAAAELEQRVEERTTALHQAIAARQRLEREAQRVQHFALLGRLAAGVSHEIRNPLGAVFLHVDLLAEELRDHAPESAELVADTLAEIRTQLARLDDLVQDYLSLVRVAQIERTPTDLGAVLRTWTTEWQALGSAQGIACQFDGLDDLGIVAVHANTLRRALLNLVQNALEAMPQGGTLTLRGRRLGATIQLDVCDTGSGISPVQRTRIFEPLYTTKAGGTGLGLYIVQEVVAAHGGQVVVQSVEGQGSTFTLTLPLLESQEAPQGAD
jgi:PAS domain S-box-containing protein